MKNFQVNLLIVLALGLCGLCVWQWYEQTIQRDEITTMNGMIYEKNAAIQGYTNSLATLNHQVNQMDASLTEIKAAAAPDPDQYFEASKLYSLACAKQKRWREAAEYPEFLKAMHCNLEKTWPEMLQFLDECEKERKK